MWALWNKAIVVNTWKIKVDDSINQTCPLCNNEENPHCTNFESVVMHNRLGSSYKALCVNFDNKPSQVVAPLQKKVAFH
jgi:hypothetical protein